MIIVYHKNNQISSVISENNGELLFDRNITVAGGLCQLAVRFPKSKIVWCNEAYKENLYLKEIEFLFHHDKMMISYTPDGNSYLGRKIGYVEESPFVKINKEVSYPTWQMSSLVGVIHASLLIGIKDKIKFDSDFDYYLNSVAKVCMPLGLMCYSEPRLLKIKGSFSEQRSSIFTLFKFVKQHYKTRWILLLLLNLLIYERKFPFLAYLYSSFFKNRNKKGINLDKIVVKSSLKVVDEATIDVVIPTIGRKKYLYDVLCDLSIQTHLPKNIIIVEQNPLPESESELDYLYNEEWPFVIEHAFTHQAGACNARNIAFSKVKSEWVFLNDDDNRFGIYLIEDAFKNIKKNGAFVALTFYPHAEEKLFHKNISQSAIFGSGNSFFKSLILKKVSFNTKLEFGYGEDSDFGMQLRNNGYDVIYFPKIIINHLRAPMGGFRTKPILAWQDTKVQPKPSPTIMLFKLMQNTKEQLLGYKIILFFKYYKLQKIKNPMKYYTMFQKQWVSSVFWANELNKKQ